MGFTLKYKWAGQNMGVWGVISLSPNDHVHCPFIQWTPLYTIGSDNVKAVFTLAYVNVSDLIAPSGTFFLTMRSYTTII